MRIVDVLFIKAVSRIYSIHENTWKQVEQVQLISQKGFLRKSLFSLKIFFKSSWFFFSVNILRNNYKEGKPLIAF